MLTPCKLAKANNKIWSYKWLDTLIGRLHLNTHFTLINPRLVIKIIPMIYRQELIISSTIVDIADMILPE